MGWRRSLIAPVRPFVVGRGSKNGSAVRNRQDGGETRGSNTMKTLRKYTRPIAIPLAAFFFAVTGPVTSANAAMVSTQEAVSQQAAAADRAMLNDVLQRDDVRQQMTALGVDPDEAEARIAAMSDQEVHRIAQHVGELPSGQGAIGAVIGVALFIFVVLLITDIFGLTKVFPFTRDITN
jgi:hypothetical protein